MRKDKYNSFSFLNTLSVFFGLFVLFLSQSPGKNVADTKLDLIVNPLGFLAKATHIWNSYMPLGQIQNQAYGYFFPQGFFYAIMHKIFIPNWISQRLWWAIVLTIGWVGIIKLAEALKVGSFYSRIIAGLVFITAPRVLTTITSISSETLPVMLAPWILLPVVKITNLNSRLIITTPSRLTNRLVRNPNFFNLISLFLAASSALAFGLTGAVNAVASFAAVLPAVVWWGSYVSYMGIIHKLHLSILLKKFTLFWGLFLMLVSLWWLGPLLLMGKYSPPFLNYIESAKVTTKWNSLAETLRGTIHWTPYVTDVSVIGKFLISNMLIIFITGLVAILGIYGLVKSHFGRKNLASVFLMVMLLVGICLITVGYSGEFSSPFSALVQKSLDGFALIFRNVHKFEPLVRIPIVIGIANLIPYQKYRKSFSIRIFFSKLLVLKNFQDHNPVISLLTLILVLLSIASFNNRILTQASFNKLPNYWNEAVNWLNDNLSDRKSNSDFKSRVLILPGANFAYQDWGYTRDEPIQPLAKFPWAVRDSIPLVPPDAIRAMDSVEKQVYSGIPSNSLAKTLNQQGYKYIILRADLDFKKINTSYITQVNNTLINSLGIERIKTFGPIIRLNQDKILPEGGVQTDMPAIQIFSINSKNINFIAPHIISSKDVKLVIGGAESILDINDTSTFNNQFILNPKINFNDVNKYPFIVTDTPKARETNYGEVKDNTSAIRAINQMKDVANSVSDYQAANSDPIYLVWKGAQVAVSSSAADASQVGKKIPTAAARSAFDGSEKTSWISGGLTGGVGQWLDIKLDKPVNALGVSLQTAKTIGTQVNKINIVSNLGSITTKVTPGKDIKIVLPKGETDHIRITAVDTTDHSQGVQFGISEIKLIDLEKKKNILVNAVVKLPHISPKTSISKWILTQEKLGTSACYLVTIKDNLQKEYYCNNLYSHVAAEPEEFRRSIYAPATIKVIPELYLQPKYAELSGFLANQINTKVFAPSSFINPVATDLALIDDDNSTVWQAKLPESNGVSTIPRIRILLSKREIVRALKLKLPLGNYYAKPTLIAVNLGTGRKVISVKDDFKLVFPPHLTQQIDINILRWQVKYAEDEFNRQTIIPPAIAGISVYDADLKKIKFVSKPVKKQIINLPCGSGPNIKLNQQVLTTSVQATMEDINANKIIKAKVCVPNRTFNLVNGFNDISVGANSLFSVAKLILNNKKFVFSQINSSFSKPKILFWNNFQRVLKINSLDENKLLIIPESYNSGWMAKTEVGEQLVPVMVNGWQQAWVLPRGIEGKIFISFPLDKWYQLFLKIGLILFLIIIIAILLIYKHLKKSKYILANGFYSTPVYFKKLSYPKLYNFLVLSVIGISTGLIGILVFIMLNILKITKLKKMWNLKIPVLFGILAYMLTASSPWQFSSHYWANITVAQILLLITLVWFSLELSFYDKNYFTYETSNKL